jgi:hypothetical protein
VLPLEAGKAKETHLFENIFYWIFIYLHFKCYPLSQSISIKNIFKKEWKHETLFSKILSPNGRDNILGKLKHFYFILLSPTE